MKYNKLNKDFKNKGYVLVKDVLDKSMCAFLYNYCKMRYVNLLDFKDTPWYRDKIDGLMGDGQCENAASWYSDPLFESLLVQLLNTVSSVTNTALHPNYSYWRMYVNRNILKKHIDRPACELSTTMCIGYDIANLSDKSYNWPMYIKAKKKKAESITMDPGDMLVYKGCELEHWREPFKGNNHAQCFLHYNDVKNGKGKKFDGRPRLGLPSEYSATRHT